MNTQSLLLKSGIMLLVIVVLLILNIMLGSVHIPFKQVAETISGGIPDNPAWTTIISSRISESIVAISAGIGLSLCGFQLQTLFRNPLAGPSVLGITSGASLGVAIILMTSIPILGSASGYLAVVIAGIIGAAGVLLLLVLFAGKIKHAVTLLIIGLMIGYATSALVNIMTNYAANDEIKQFVIWGFGSFASLSSSQITLFSLLISIGVIVSFLLVKSLSALLIGEDYAHSMGVNIKRTRIGIIFCSGLLAGTVTAFCGPIAFIGLIVPHIARIIFKNLSMMSLYIGVIFTGAAAALLCDIFANFPIPLPLNAITSLLGAPVVIWIIFKGNIKFSA